MSDFTSIIDEIKLDGLCPGLLTAANVVHSNISDELHIQVFFLFLIVLFQGERVVGTRYTEITNSPADEVE